MKLPIINNQEIVPVRLIPIITANALGRQLIAGILTHRIRASGFPLNPVYDQVEFVADGETTMVNKAELFGRCSRDVEIYAFHMNEDNEPVRILSTEWDEIYRDISVLEPILRKEEQEIGVPDSKESTWMIESLKILPPGVFLWRKDLDILWQAHNNYYLSLPGEREDRRKMNYDALVLPKYRELVLEGFEGMMKTDTSTCRQHEPKQNTKIQANLLKMVIAMAMDCYGYQPSVKKNTAISDIMKALDSYGLSLSKNTIRARLHEAAELLPGDLKHNS